MGEMGVDPGCHGGIFTVWVGYNGILVRWFVE
jgi:hypothetical protein